jgi:4-hydroxybenzoate polyprenyltransferase
MIGLVAMSMIYSSSTLLGIEVGNMLYLAGFLICFSTYSLNRVIEKKEDSKQHMSRAKYIGKYYKQILIFSVIAYSIGVILIAAENVKLIPVSMVPIIFVLLYTVKLPVNHKLKRIKDVTIGKNMCVAVSWTIFIVLTVYSYSSAFSFFPIMITSFFFISRIFINTVVFDIRDHEGDKANGIQTMPVYIGIEKTKNIVIVMNVFLGIFMVVVGLLGVMGPLSYFAAISSVYAAIYIYLLGKNENKKNVICDFIVDGEYFANSGFLFIGTLIV